VEDPADALSDIEQRALVDEHLDYDELLRENGYYLISAALQQPETAAIVRVRAGRLSITDGPFAETKEHVAGFILIEAQDLNEAIQVASKIPSARYGFIEVRPVWELERSGG
jgi:hypothetical protein